MSDEDEMAYAHPDGVEGLLQRGRGLGAVRVLRDPRGAAGYVYDGVRRDRRRDGTDDRSLYLARLVQELGLSPMPVVDQLVADEETCLRACDVLELLALAGWDEADLRPPAARRPPRPPVIVIVFDMDCPGWEEEAIRAADPPDLIEGFLAWRSWTARPLPSPTRGRHPLVRSPAAVPA